LLSRTLSSTGQWFPDKIPHTKIIDQIQFEISSITSDQEGIYFLPTLTWPSTKAPAVIGAKNDGIAARQFVMPNRVPAGKVIRIKIQTMTSLI
jgi:hypothetical protein